MLLAKLLILVAIGVYCYYIYYFRFPHCYYPPISFISQDAKIIDITHTKEKWGRERFIKTVVKFSDGFEYHTHEIFREPRLFYSRIYVDDEVREIILTKSIKAHERIVKRKIKQLAKTKNQSVQ